jgi:hypothetical protein
MAPATNKNALANVTRTKTRVRHIVLGYYAPPMIVFHDSCQQHDSSSDLQVQRQLSSAFSTYYGAPLSALKKDRYSYLTYLEYCSVPTGWTAIRK